MWVQDVPVRVERVPCIPHGAKVLIDEPNGGMCVAWIREDLDDETAAILIARSLTVNRPIVGLPLFALHAS